MCNVKCLMLNVECGRSNVLVAIKIFNPLGLNKPNKHNEPNKLNKPDRPYD